MGWDVHSSIVHNAATIQCDPYGLQYKDHSIY